VTQPSHDTSSPPEPTLRLRSPADVVEMVPYLLGFQPQDSLVVLALEHDNGSDRVGVVARVDRVPIDSAEVAEVLDQLFAAVCRDGAAQVIAVFYGTRPGSDEVRALRWAGQRARCELVDVLAVGERTWRSVVCRDARCCPPGGHALPSGPGELAAAATYAGMVARPDRASVEAILAPAPRAERAALRAGLAAAQAALDRGVAAGQAGRAERSAIRALFAASRRLGVLTAAETCHFGVALRRTAVRDACWLAVDERRIDGDGLWRELARRLPDGYSAPPLFLFGWLQWRSGNGTLATMAAQRALDADPDYSAAALLNTAVQHGLNPFTTPRLRRRGGTR
jgi:Domain of unknown function (DUF4192)